MPKEVDFAAVNLSKRPFRILRIMFLKTKYDHIDSGFRFFEDLKTSHIKARNVNVFDERQFHCYPEEVHRSFCCCYIPLLVLCSEYFEYLNIVFFLQNIQTNGA